MALDFDYWAARDKGYSDDDILNGLQKRGQLEFDLSAARKAGYSSSDIMQGLLGAQTRRPEPTPAPEPTSLLRRAGDVGVSLLRGAVAIPETAIGLADLVTGGAAGRAAESIGVRTKDAKEILAELYSPEQQAALKRVAEAKGFVDTAGALLENPSTILQTAAESAPSMLAGGGIARGVASIAPRIAPYAAAAIGEGAVGAGQAAERIRQESADGSLSAGQAAAALGSGVGTGLFGAIGGRIAQKLGIGDIDTALVQAGTNMTSKGVARRIVEGGITEGVLEELPQSVQEQIWQNAAMDRPLLEGVPESAAQGLLVGAAFGGVAGGALTGRPPAAAPEPEVPPAQLGYDPDQWISFPDGSVGKRADAENFINNLPEEQRNAARARLFGLGEQQLTEADVLNAASVDEAIRVAERATAESMPEFQAQRNTEIDAAWGQYLADLTNTREIEFMAAEEARRAAETPGLLDQLADQRVAEAEILTEAQGYGAEEPNAIQLAMQRAQEQRQRAIGAAEQRATLSGQPLAAGMEASEAAAPADQVEQARQILTAAGVTGNERMAALRSIRTGENTLDDLIDAHPPKATNVADQLQTTPAGGPLRPAGLEVPAPQQPAPTAGRAPDAALPAGGAGLRAAERPVVSGRTDLPVPDGTDRAAPLNRISGDRIDSDWVRFAPESRTLNVPRERMPQVKAEHRGALTQFLAARGIPHTEAQEVAPDSLRPTQREFSEKKVRQAQDYQGGDRSILVSADNYIVDGHHQWLAKLAANEPVKVIRLNAPIKQLLREVSEFPSAEASRGAPTQGGQNATEKISQQGGVQGERPQGDRIRETSEAGRGDRVQRAAGGEERQPARAASGQGQVSRLVVPRQVSGYPLAARQAWNTQWAAIKNLVRDGAVTDADAARVATIAAGNPDAAGRELGKLVAEIKRRQRGSDTRASRGQDQTTGLPAADVSRAIAKLRAKWLGSTKINVVQSVEDLPPRLAEQSDEGSEGWYDASSNTVYLIADNLSSPERAAWVAAHEVVGHGGLRQLRDKSINEALNLAGANRFVGQLADAIVRDRGAMPRDIAVEEAVSELAAAVETDDFASLEDRYGVSVPQASRNGLRGAVARVFEAVKRFLSTITGQPVSKVSDADVRDLIGQQQAAVEGRASAPRAPAGEAAMASVSEPASNAVQQFEVEMQRKYPGIRLDLMQRRNGDILLSRVVVPMDQREGGIGTKFMRDLTDYADKNGQRIVLSPSADFGGNAKRLVDFYKRFGFIENKGKNRDFSTTESMYRDPVSGGTDSRASRAPRQPTAPEEVIPKWAENLTAEQKAALRKSGAIYTEKTWRQKVDEMREGALKKLQYGILDQFAPIKDMLGKTPYVLARMAKNADGTLEALMLYGRPHLDSEGGMLVDTTKKGFVETMQQLQGEHDRFFSWLAGKRAEQLKREGRENLFTDEDISSLSTLNQGKMKDGTSREAAYLRAQKDVAELNKSVLDIAEKSGLIDAESRKIWASDYYVPFYRVMEEGITGPSVKSGLVNQKSIKKLKGGKNNLGDLTQNMLMNWSTLLTASAKNRAAKATLDAAADIGAAIEAPEATIRDMAKSTGNKAVSYMESGKNRWFTVEDPHLLQAISSLEFSGYNNQAMKVMTAFKNWLTMAVTSLPGFKVRNLIRDSLSSIAVAPADYNPLKNIKNGYSVLRDNDIRANLIAGGGVFRFGTFMDGNRGEYVKQLIDEGVPADTILDTAGKMNKFFRKLWKGYQEVGDISENLNRAALYKKLRAEGKSHLEASFEARDLMDFGLSGAWAGVRALNQVLPFFNARLQGVYKLGRGYNDDPRRMGNVVGALTLATIALSLAYKDDDDFKKRTEADRNNYWWFKVGDTAYRIPKPFEVGAAATAIDNLLAQLYDSENTDSKRLMEQMGDIVNAQLAMNPIPQVFRPLIDVYANKDAFTGRPIESLAMQRLRPEDRYTYNTSELARLLSKSGVLVDPISLAAGTGVKQLSPVQIDAIIRGYFSGVGTLASSAVDGLLHHTVIDRGEALPMTLKQMTGNFAEELPSNTSRYVDKLYNSATEIEQSYASYQNALKQGDLAKAREIYEDEGEKIAKYHLIDSLKKNEIAIGRQIQRVINDKMMTGEQKEEAVRRYKKLQDQIARQLAMRQ